jgi:methyl-accepting chemotaxis protein
LADGRTRPGEYKRIAKGGREVWINGSYNPAFDAGGKVTKVIKLAADITESKVRSAGFEAQVKAIDKQMAVIEFIGRWNDRRRRLRKP